MAPGLPQASNDLCYRAGRVMNHGDGIYGGMFVSCMYAAAFFESDPQALVSAGLACLPAESPYARLIGDVIEWSEQHPEDWITVWNLVEERWNKREPCPEGAANPFNIDAKLNGAYIALGMLYGGGDFGKTMTISTRCGQDSDCNPASALGILGVVSGLEGIPDEYKSGIEQIADEKFSYTNYSFRTIVDSTEKRAIAMAETTRRTCRRRPVVREDPRCRAAGVRILGRLRIPRRARSRHRSSVVLGWKLGGQNLELGSPAHGQD